jgi:hypothetical protein
VDLGVKGEDITFFTDCGEKAALVRYSPRYKGVNIQMTVFHDKGIETMTQQYRKRFDGVCLNAPYQPEVKENKKGGGSGSRNVLHDKFTKLALAIVKDGGEVANIHPQKWRKPKDEIYPLISKLQVRILKINSSKKGMEVFNAATAFDWYVLENIARYGKTKIVYKESTEDGEVEKVEEFDLSSFPFLPSSNFHMMDKLVAKSGEKRCTVLFDRMSYGTDQRAMSMEKSDVFSHPCLNKPNYPKAKDFLAFSDYKGSFFNTPKVVFTECGIIHNCVVDFKGEYGITQNAIGLKITSEEEGQNIKRALESKQFKDFLPTFRWSTSRIDWRMFEYFKADFWKEFIHE